MISINSRVKLTIIVFLSLRIFNISLVLAGLDIAAIALRDAASNIFARVCADDGVKLTSERCRTSASVNLVR